MVIGWWGMEKKCQKVMLVNKGTTCMIPFLSDAEFGKGERKKTNRTPIGWWRVKYWTACGTLIENRSNMDKNGQKRDQKEWPKKTWYRIRHVRLGTVVCTYMFAFDYLGILNRAKEIEFFSKYIRMVQGCIRKIRNVKNNLEIKLKTDFDFDWCERSRTFRECLS